MNFLQSAYYKIKGVLGIGIVDDIRKVYPQISENYSYYIHSGLGGSARSRIDNCLNIYSGNPPWFEGCDKETTYNLNVAKVICRYLSTYNTAEFDVSVTPKGYEYGTDEVTGETLVNDSEVQTFIHNVLTDSAFYENLTIKDEQKEAIGDYFMKPYVDGDSFKIDFVPITQFFPIAWNNRRFTQGVFVSYYTKDKWSYTRLEAHLIDTIDGIECVVIENSLWRKDKTSSVGLGESVSLTGNEAKELGLSDIEKRVVFNRSDPLFAHIYVNEANNKDINSPLHLSRFENAIDILKAIDKAYNEWQQARIDSRIKILAPAEWFRKMESADGTMRVAYDSETKAYQRLNYKDIDSQKAETFQPDYIVDRYVADINAQLSLIALHTGLSPGSISFDRSGGLRTIQKTAEEIRSENGETFATVSSSQTILQEGITDLLRSIVFLAKAFGKLNDGVATEYDYDYAVDFDDSITPSRDSYIAEGLKLYSEGAISHYKLLVDYLTMTPADANAEIERINQEKSRQRATVPTVFGMGLESD